MKGVFKKMATQPCVSLDIESKLKSVSQGVRGDQLVIEAQSYLRVMGFPIGNFGVNHNGSPFKPTPPLTL